MKKSRRPKHAIGRRLEQFSESVSVLVGTSWAFLIAAAIVVVWALTGPLFHYSDTWQLAINTLTTLVTFLMVFLIQRSQNKSMEAVELKVNELVAAAAGASNRLIDVESLSEQELKFLHGHFRALVEMSKKDDVLTRSHSVEEALCRHESKKSMLRPRRDTSSPREG